MLPVKGICTRRRRPTSITIVALVGMSCAVMYFMLNSQSISVRFNSQKTPKNTNPDDHKPHSDFTSHSLDTEAVYNLEVAPDNVQTALSNVQVHRRQKTPPQTTKWEVKGSGCQVPSFQPHDSVIDSFSKKLSPPECKGEPWLTAVEGGTLFLNTSLLHSRKERADNCTYEEIVWLRRDEEITFSQPTVFTDVARPGVDFVRVQCDVTNVMTRKPRRYTAYHFLMQEHLARERTLQSRLRKRKRLSRDWKLPDEAWANSPDWLNVVMVGMDSVSRHNNIRLMPNTRRFLLNELHAIELTNYNKVGDNTFPNMFGLNTGLTLEEAEWDETLRRAQSEHQWDDLHWDHLKYRFLWEDFAQQGYRTLYNEDEYKINIFFLENITFRESPTHFYGRSLEIAKEIHSGLFSQDDKCFGGIPSDHLMLSYPLEFIRLFRNKPHFSFTFLVRTTHNTMNGAGQIDGQVSDFLAKLKEEGLTRNTVLLVFSDHGVRYGPFRSTPVGRFEDSRPFMFLVFPDWFRKLYSHQVERVQNNAARFITPLDVHATLLDLLFLKHKDPLHGKRKHKHGISLFRTIPDTRTCLEAGIPAHHCVCLADRPQQTASALARAAGAALVASLNEALWRVRHLCHTLTLANLKGFVQLEDGEDYLQRVCAEGAQADGAPLDGPVGDRALYRVTVLTDPGGGVMEGTLAKCGQRSSFMLVGHYGQISRLNRYGKTASCVGRSRYLEKFCYCKHV